MIVLAFMVLVLSLAYYISLGLFRIGFRQHIKDGQAESENLADQAERLPVSVIVPMRNEEKHIEKCVHSILDSNLDRPFELIVVDDHSTDQSKELVSQIAVSTESLRLLESDKEGKKAALQVGIDSAKHPLLFLTDADCILRSNTIKSMVEKFTDGVEMVTGPVLYGNAKSTFVKMQNLDLLGLVAVGAGSLKMGMASMCNGANLAFTKAGFEMVGGYQGNEHISSGDDLFLMHKFYDRSPSSVRFCSEPEAIVETIAEKDLGSFIAQRRRWASKGRAYTNSKLRLLALLVFLVNFGILTMSLSIIWRPDLKYFLLASIVFKLLADFRLLYAACTHFNKKLLLSYFIPEQLLHIPYTVFIGISSQFGRIMWKERELAR